MPATQQPLIGWSPELRVDTLSLVRPLPWARAIPGLRFTPETWGRSVFRMKAPGGTHMLVRGHGAPELSLWLPAGLPPSVGEPFGLYLHTDRHHAARVRAASMLVRALRNGMPLRRARYPHAPRQAVMLYIHDMIGTGVSLREIAAVLLDPAPDDWRTSSERSDMRRLADAAADMVQTGYRTLLRVRSRSE